MEIFRQAHYPFFTGLSRLRSPARGPGFLLPPFGAVICLVQGLYASPVLTCQPLFSRLFSSENTSHFYACFFIDFLKKDTDRVRQRLILFFDDGRLILGIVFSDRNGIRLFIKGIDPVAGACLDLLIPVRACIQQCCLRRSILALDSQGRLYRSRQIFVIIKGIGRADQAVARVAFRDIAFDRGLLKADIALLRRKVVGQEDLINVVAAACGRCHIGRA